MVVGLNFILIFFTQINVATDKEIFETIILQIFFKLNICVFFFDTTYQ